jgi:hypothetical protein
MLTKQNPKQMIKKIRKYYLKKNKTHSGETY